jgi:hypothetical protein
MKFLKKLKNEALFLIFCFISVQAYAINQSSKPYYDLKNVEGYVSVEKNGVVKHFIVISTGNGVELLPTDENPKNFLNSISDLTGKINNLGGKKNEK